jgi:hypothetical protein
MTPHFRQLEHGIRPSMGLWLVQGMRCVALPWAGRVGRSTLPRGQPKGGELAGFTRRKALHAVGGIGQQTGSNQRL